MPACEARGDFGRFGKAARSTVSTFAREGITKNTCVYYDEFTTFATVPICQGKTDRTRRTVVHPTHYETGERRASRRV